MRDAGTPLLLAAASDGDRYGQHDGSSVELSNSGGFNLPKHRRHSNASLASEAGLAIGLGVRNRSVSAALRKKADKMESFDFGPYDSEVNRIWDESKDMRYFRRVDVARWVMTFLIGVFTALTAVLITYVSDYLSQVKFKAVSKVIAYEQAGEVAFGTACAVLFAFSGVYGALACAPVAFVNAIAGGSGISEIKCLLNGVKIPKAVRITTLVCKVVGVMFSVGSGLPVGKEGPMIHSGAILGAGMSQGKSTTLKVDTSWSKFKDFRNDIEKRDFVVCGAAAGVAAAFGAPVGGVLFALEEGASFWFQSLTWRAFACAMISTYVLDIFLSGISPDANWGDLSTPGMFSFGDFNNPNTKQKNTYTIYEVPVFIMMGVVGGLMGAVFNGLNTYITKWRLKRVQSAGRRMFETILIASSFAVIGFWVSWLTRSCKQQPHEVLYSSSLIQFYCPDGQYDESATLFITPSEDAILQLFHMPGDHAWSPGRLVIFFFIYAFYTCWTYGASVPSGLFIPSLLSGSAFGRIVGDMLNHAFPGRFVDPGTYSLIGAAAFLGGMARMTISLAVILLESTGDYQFGLPLMVTLLAARWTGNVFNEGLYDIHIELRHWPLLEQDPLSVVHKLSVQDVMSPDPVVVDMFPKAEDVLSMLLRTEHNGFPVLYPAEMIERYPALGNFAGIINRKHLCVLLDKRALQPRRPDIPTVDEVAGTGAASFHSFGGRHHAQDREQRFSKSNSHIRQRAMSFTSHAVEPVLSHKDMEGTFPRFPPAHSIQLRPEDYNCYLDLRPYMNSVPFVVKEKAPAMQAFRLFRGLGMRHLVVVNDVNRVRGVITRQNLTHHALEATWHKASQEARHANGGGDPHFGHM